MATYTSFTELDCWKKCRLVRLHVEELIKNKIPKSDYDMIQNIRRAGRSTTRNIAEGFGRHHVKENLQYLRISRGSLFEIDDDYITCFDAGFINDSELKSARDLLYPAIKSVNGFIEYLKTRK